MAKIKIIDDDVELGHERIIENLLKPFMEDDKMGITGVSQLLPENSNSFQKIICH